MKEALAQALPQIISMLFVSVIMPAAGAIALRWAKKQEWSKSIALDAIAAGVDHAWETMGKQIKAASADGKFTPEERQRLRRAATQTAMGIARDHGVNLAKTLGPMLIESAIKTAVQRRKVAVSVPIPNPDLVIRRMFMAPPIAQPTPPVGTSSELAE